MGCISRARLSRGNLLTIAELLRRIQPLAFRNCSAKPWASDLTVNSIRPHTQASSRQFRGERPAPPTETDFNASACFETSMGGIRVGMAQRFRCGLLDRGATWCAGRCSVWCRGPVLGQHSIPFLKAILGGYSEGHQFLSCSATLASISNVRPDFRRAQAPVVQLGLPLINMCQPRRRSKAANLSGDIALNQGCTSYS